MSGVLVKSVTTKPVGVGVGGVSPPATGVWGITPEKFFLMLVGEF